MKKIRTMLLLATVFATAGSTGVIARAADSADAGYAVQKTWSIGGEGRWDYATFDPSSNRLYVTRSTHTQAIDISTGKVIADITGQKHSHGIAVAPAANRGFITDGKDGSIVVFDLKSDQVLGKIAAAQDADGCIFDAGTNHVLATCGDAGKLAVVAPDVELNSAKADLVELGGSPEFLAADGAGKAYVNLNDKNEIAVVDLKSLSVVNRWPTGSGTKPTGLAIDPAHHLLFIGCRNQKLVVMNTEDGKVQAELPIGKGNDACGFDPGASQAFASCGDGTLTIVKESSGGKFDAAAVETRQGARTMALDPATHVVYLPTAEFEAPTAKGKRPAMKPNTFMIVVVAPTAAGQ